MIKRSHTSTLIISTFALIVSLTGYTAEAKKTLDGGCTSVSVAPNNRHLLVVNGAGELFNGTLDTPLMSYIPIRGEARQARYVAAGTRVLVHYQSGAVDLLDTANLARTIWSAPAYSYSEIVVSSDGRIAAALDATKTTIYVIDLSTAKPTVVRKLEHSMGLSYKAASAIAAPSQVALLDENGKVQLINWKTGAEIQIDGESASGPYQAITLLSSGALWIVPSTEQTNSRAISKIDEAEWLTSKIMIGWSRIIESSDGTVLINYAPEGFLNRLRRIAPGKYERLGDQQIVAGLQDAAILPHRDRIVLCSDNIDIVSLDGKSLYNQMRGANLTSIFVDNVSGDGRYALVRDTLGRGLIWSIPDSRIALTLPIVRLKVFPAKAAIHGKSLAYVSFGQNDVVTASVPARDKAGKAQLAFKTRAIALPYEKKQPEIWESGIYFSPNDEYLAFVIRPERIYRVIFNPYDGPEGFKYVDVPDNQPGCTSFSTIASVSEAGKQLAVACDSVILIYDIAGKKLDDIKLIDIIHVPEWSFAAREKTFISSMAYSPDSRLLAFVVRRQYTYLERFLSDTLASEKPTIFVYDISSKKIKSMGQKAHVPVTAVGFDSTSSQLWVGGYYGWISVYDVASARMLGQPRGGVGTVFGIVAGENHEMIAWTSDSEVIQFNTPTGAAIKVTKFYDGGRSELRYSSSTTIREISPVAQAVLAIPLSADSRARIYEGLPIDVSLRVSAAFQSSTQALLYVDGAPIANGVILGVTDDGVMHLKFPTAKIPSGRLGIGLFSPDGGTSNIVDLGRIVRNNEDISQDVNTNRIVGAFVGISTYDSPTFSSLPLAKKDAEVAANAFRQPNAELRVFDVNNKPTKSAVLTFLESVRDTTGPNDTLILFLAGHGYSHSGDFFYATTESVRDSPSKDLRGISSDDLVDLIANGRQRRTMLILDTCESSAFINAVLSNPKLAEGPMAIGSLGTVGHPISVVAAATELTAAKDGYNGRGLLTGVIVSGLEGEADGDKDGNISQEELLSYVETNMSKVSRAAFPRLQPQDPVLHYSVSDFRVRSSE